MRAVQFREFGGEIEVVDVPMPQPGAGGVVIKVEATGLCRSDWHAWQGHDTDITVFPHVLGHEFAGVVAAVGEGVTRVAVGDRVAVPFVCGCGECTWCLSGNAQVSGNGLIFWASKVGTENGTLTVYNTKDSTLQVTRGCFIGTVDEFLAASERRQDDDTHFEYRLLIEVAHSRIARARAKLEGGQ